MERVPMSCFRTADKAVAKTSIVTCTLAKQIPAEIFAIAKRFLTWIRNGMSHLPVDSI